MPLDDAREAKDEMAMAAEKATGERDAMELMLHAGEKMTMEQRKALDSTPTRTTTCKRISEAKTAINARLEKALKAEMMGERAQRGCRLEPT